MKKKLTIKNFQEMKTKKESVAAVVLYENWMAKQAEKAKIDWILVGDSVNMAIYGEKSTAIHPPSMSCMLKHADAVQRGAPNTFIVGDMPEGSYGCSDKDIMYGIYNANDFIDEARCDAIKLEGGVKMAPQVKAMVENGISVMGHIGLTPQTIPEDKWGTVHGEMAEEAMALLEDAKALEEAGAFAILLEKVAEETARLITQELSIPIFSIGAGRYCDGQLLLSCDILRSFDLFNIKFVKNYLTPQRLFNIATTASLNNTVSGFAELAKECFSAYASDVKEKLFPEEKHIYHMKPGEFEKFQRMLKK
jgi:3-methyl-2-oxobutanoate hydroxymethyltransferase